MKNLKLKLAVALLTFFGGTGVTVLFQAQRIQTITFCELLGNPQRYHEKTIRVRGLLFNFNDKFLFGNPNSESCKIYTTIDVELNQTKTLTPKINQLISGMQDHGDSGCSRAAQVVITGKVNFTKEMSDDALGFFISDARIETVGDKGAVCR